MTDYSNREYVELHDAHLESLLVLSDGGGIVSVKNIVVFFPVEKDVFDVWSYEGRILLENINKISLDESFSVNDRIMDVTTTNEQGEELEICTLSTRTTIREINFSFSSGTKLTIGLQSAMLKLDKPMKKLERWLGPLISVEK